LISVTLLIEFDLFAVFEDYIHSNRQRCPTIYRSVDVSFSNMKVYKAMFMHSEAMKYNNKREYSDKHDSLYTCICNFQLNMILCTQVFVILSET